MPSKERGDLNESAFHPVWYDQVVTALHTSANFEGIYEEEGGQSAIERGIFHTSSDTGESEVVIVNNRTYPDDSRVDISSRYYDDDLNALPELLSVSTDHIDDIIAVNTPQSGRNALMFINKHGTLITSGEGGQLVIKSGNYENAIPGMPQVEIVDVYEDNVISDVWLTQLGNMFNVNEGAENWDKIKKESKGGIFKNGFKGRRVLADGRLLSLDLNGDYCADRDDPAYFELSFKLSNGQDDMEMIRMSNIYSISVSAENDLYFFSENPATDKISMLVVTPSGEYFLCNDKDFDPPMLITRKA